MVEAQKWLTDNYENKKDNKTGIRIGKNIELEGKLIIDGYPKLKDIFLGEAKGITELTIIDCPNVEVILVSRNQITKIEGLANLPKLQQLSFGSNKIEEIDISQNKQLKLLHFANNPPNLKFVNGIKNLPELVFWNSSKTFAITKLLEQATGEDLKEIAGGLKLDVEGKTPEEIKNIIKEEVDKIEQNKTKINEKLPGLLDQTTAIVNDVKLEEIKSNVGKGEKYQKLVDEATNAPIVDKDKKEIDQNKLTDQLGKATDYEKLVNDNKDLVTEDGKKIDQQKINDLRTASGDAAEAIKILGVNLKPDTLNAILGGSKLSDIHSPETLKSILESKEKLENVLKEAGINPNTADLENQLAKWNHLEKIVKELYDENYEEIFGMQIYQNQVEVNTNNKN